MAIAPQKVVLISRGRHDEAILGADCYPGMAGLLNSSNQVIPHNVPGGGGPLLVLKEDALQGLDITQKLPQGTSPYNVAPFQRAAKGDLLTMLLQNGQNVAAQTSLMSAGDGTLIANPGNPVYQITTPSSVITNTATETAFSNGSYTIPANFLQVGDRIHIRAKAFLIAVNSTNTHRVRLYIGATPVTLADSTALALIANDVVIFDIFVTVRAITSSGTIIADGTVAYSVSGTFTSTTTTLASTTLDSTVAETIVIKSLASAASAGNQIRLDEFQINFDRDAGLNTLVVSQEAINNSSGTGTSGFNSAALIRCMVP